MYTSSFTSLRHPDQQRALFSAKNGLKRPKNVKSALICAIFRYFALFIAHKKCAHHAHTFIHLHSPSWVVPTSGALFFRPKTASNSPKTGNPPYFCAIFRYFALFLDVLRYFLPKKSSIVIKLTLFNYFEVVSAALAPSGSSKQPKNQPKKRNPS